MIYLIIFLYLLVLAFLYDICQYEKHKTFHFVFALIVLILVSGLRYRLGADTVVYESDYKYYHTIFDIRKIDFVRYEHEPLWVILNSLCKTISDNFVIVQLVVSFIHISIWAIFVYATCYDISFLMLLFFLLFEFTHIDMTLMREALSISFFLLGVLALNNRRFWLFLMLGVCSMLFHRFSIFVFFLLFLFYKLLSCSRFVEVLIVIVFLCLAIFNGGWIQGLLGNFLFSNSQVVDDMIKYAISEQYGGSSLNWKGHMSLFITVLVYATILLFGKCYKKDVALDERLFSSIIILSIIVLLIKDSFAVFYRIYDYFQTFTSLLALSWFIQFCKKYSIKGQLLLFSVFMLIPLWSTYKYYSGPWGVNPSSKIHKYMEFCPYSSVINPQKDEDREKGILRYRKLH